MIPGQFLTQIAHPLSCQDHNHCMDWRPDPIVNYIATYLYYGYGFIT